MGPATSRCTIAFLSVALHGTRADRIYFNLTGSSHSSNCGSSSYQSFTLGNAPQVVHVTRPTTVIVTQQPTTILVTGNSRVVIQQWQRPYACRPYMNSDYLYHGSAPAGWYIGVPNANRYPGFPYSYPDSSWGGRNPPGVASVANGLPNWPNSSTTQSFRSAWSLTGR
ncbi:MAG: hypothetical protein COZ06_27575 [Armatimonadetes bacterium CG_4_10_14_3_um_filter_66_18]|nr:MAG: hypothetical protein AUJ96_06755 [Armatimonadetes bacterium CG2_30_66_41]PIU90787.1 MAG: hypothetical protein COS65_24095 [Armatimonadetes bacterium CG06_land_8_20_14_3_00_66_21]PIX46108.1 MAG: hypothetical protein COZ57_13460 [Armatimonadetes bacterium CG_4_8_14_3_um_filter_66_20]PIY40848.1 MAG: hypothetical protein COZ06_27575 [Armatimonadetes bacterium CG_4_10_14_3_um_filter_66_18]PIZ34859.1 MAG: hypothetical protein COY42_27760 [Armatimonadetes bacterium CG_4_10_14_0_8_um_filter_66_